VTESYHTFTLIGGAAAMNHIHAAELAIKQLPGNLDA
jgi:hypothetical protein